MSRFGHAARIAQFMVGVVIIFIAACSNTSPNPAASHAPNPTAVAKANTLARAECFGYLLILYHDLGGNWSIGQFQAGVNAEDFAGTLGLPCQSALITRSELTQIAGQVASGSGAQ